MVPPRSGSFRVSMTKRSVAGNQLTVWPLELGGHLSDSLGGLIIVPSAQYLVHIRPRVPGVAAAAVVCPDPLRVCLSLRVRRWCPGHHASHSDGRRFGGRHLGAILGALEIGWGLGGFARAWFGGYWHDRWGRYHGAFLITIGVCLLGCVTLWLASPRKFRRGLALGLVP